MRRVHKPEGRVLHQGLGTVRCALVKMYTQIQRFFMSWPGYVAPPQLKYPKKLPILTSYNFRLQLVQETLP